MGFSLELFFEKLANALDAKELSISDQLDFIEAVINDGKQYAKDCGMIKGDK